MNKDQIKSGIFCAHYKKPTKIYQIVGIARTDDVLSYDIYNRKADFFARDASDKNQVYMGFIFPNQDIVISLNRSDPIINDKYVIYNAFTVDDYHEPRVWARKIDDFAGNLEDIESHMMISRFNMI